jgi:hypothetical protein
MAHVARWDYLARLVQRGTVVAGGGSTVGYHSEVGLLDDALVSLKLLRNLVIGEDFVFGSFI